MIRYSSTSPDRTSDRAKCTPPWASRSRPGSSFSFAISVARSPEATRVSGQSAFLRLLENTILGISFIGAAYGSVEDGQYAAISRYVTLPIRWAPACHNFLTVH